MHRQSIQALRKIKKNNNNQSDISPVKKQYRQNTLRSEFKSLLGKLLNLETREQAMKQLKNLIAQNKTTNNLRIWLSVLAQNRMRFPEYQVLIIGFIVNQYKKGLLDPLDKIPSLQKTIFRITQLITRFFKDSSPNVQLACQKAWIEIYKSCLDGQSAQFKKTLVYNTLQSMINGGADKLSQITSQILVDGLLQTALIKNDLEFFKQIAKSSLVLFLKSYIIHPASITSLQSILSFFKINNLLPLANSIVDKILYYISNAPSNSIGYKIKAQCINALGLIGEEINNGIDIYQKISDLLQNLAIDKIYAIQSAGKKTLHIWKKRRQQWRKQFQMKQQKYKTEQIQESNQRNQEYQENSYNKFPKIAQSIEQQYKQTANKFYKQQNQKKEVQKYKFNNNVDKSQNFLQKKTGNGGGNTFVDMEPPYQPHNKKMVDIKKNIYTKKNYQQAFDETIPYQQSAQFKQQVKSFNKTKNRVKQTHLNATDQDILEKWQKVLLYFEGQKIEQAYKTALEMDDDIYLIRLMLKSGPVLDKLTKYTASKLLKKMLEITKSDFMNQMFLKLSENSAKNNVGMILQNRKNKQILDTLQKVSQLDRYKKIAKNIKKRYQEALND